MRMSAGLTRRLALPAGLAAALAAGVPATPSTSASYERFAEDGRGTLFLKLARRAYLSRLLNREILTKPLPGKRRPAGPRDEPPPPEWPGEPTGMLLCLSLQGKVRGCEGEPAPPAGEMGRLAFRLGERLAQTASRGRGSPPGEEELPRATLRAWFLLSLEEMDYTDFKRAVKAGEIDPSSTAVLVAGRRGQVFVAPGEARSHREVASIARGAGVAGLFRGPESVKLFRPVPAARPLAVLERPGAGGGDTTGPGES